MNAQQKKDAAASFAAYAAEHVPTDKNMRASKRIQKSSCESPYKEEPGRKRSEGEQNEYHFLAEWCKTAGRGTSDELLLDFLRKNSCYSVNVAVRLQTVVSVLC